MTIEISLSSSQGDRVVCENVVVSMVIPSAVGGRAIYRSSVDRAAVDFCIHRTQSCQ